MRRTPVMTLLFLFWSIAFFFVPDFREALRGPVDSGERVGPFDLGARI